MNEEEAGGLAEESSEDGSLVDHMAHWVEVLDRWVRRVDLGMGARVADTTNQEGSGVDAAQVDSGTDPAQDVEG